MKFFPSQHVSEWEPISFMEILATVTVFHEYAIVRFIPANFRQVRESTDRIRRELATFAISLIQG